eukprot:8346403-Pyramimonas_sp.AAC.3
MVYLELGDPHKAVEAFMQGIEVEPGKGHISFHPAKVTSALINSVPPCAHTSPEADRTTKRLVMSYYTQYDRVSPNICACACESARSCHEGGIEGKANPSATKIAPGVKLLGERATSSAGRREVRGCGSFSVTVAANRNGFLERIPSRGSVSQWRMN